MKLICFLVIFLFSIPTIWSQNCPNGSGTWNSANAVYGYDIYGNYGDVNIYYRSSGLDYEVKIDWNSLNNELNLLSDSTMMKILEIEAVKKAVPLVTGYTCKVRVYFEKSCQAKIRSIIKVDQSSEVCCADGMNSSNYVYSRVINGVLHNFVDVYQYLNCGTKCCYREYDVGVGKHLNTGKLVVGVSPYPITYTVNSCSPISAYTDCLDPNIPIPCISGECDEE